MPAPILPGAEGIDLAAFACPDGGVELRKVLIRLMAAEVVTPGKPFTPLDFAVNNAVNHVSDQIDGLAYGWVPVRAADLHITLALLMHMQNIIVSRIETAGHA